MIVLEFSKIFWDYTLDVLPYFVLASFLGAFLQTFVGEKFLSRKLLSKPYAPLLTATLGATVPVCSCSMIPVAKTIESLSGRTYAPAIAFLITAPVLSPVVLILTFGMFGSEITFMRVIFPLIYALTGAYLFSLAFKKPPSLPVFQGSKSEMDKGRLFLVNLRSLLLTTGKYVLLGLAIAALLKVLVPPQIIASFSQSPLSYPMISLLSVPIYVCSGEEIPIAKSLMDLGMSPGQALTFMLASSGICVPTIMALLSFLPRGLVFLYTSGWFIVSILAGVVTDLLLGVN